MGRFRASLLAGVSACALAVAAPTQARADEQNPRPALFAQAPAVNPHKWNWWVEGGRSHLGGDPGVAGLNNPSFDVMPARWGWEVAGGFDWRFDSVWHLIGQFRYVWHPNGTAAHSPIGRFNVLNTMTSESAPTVVTSTIATVSGANRAYRRETHWLADFMVGRDLGLGRGLPSLARFGVRIAKISGTTSGQATWVVPPAPNGVTERRYYTQTNTFFGIGPRIEFNGSIPLVPRWAVEYASGMAMLYGPRKATQTVTIGQSNGGAVVGATCFAGCPIDASFSDSAWVFNTDFMIGLSYALSANYSLMLNYRFDGYWKALKGFDSVGQPANLDRFYQGVFLRLTMAR